jgi:hypothetical protein
MRYSHFSLLLLLTWRYTPIHQPRCLCGTGLEGLETLEIGELELELRLCFDLFYLVYFTGGIMTLWRWRVYGVRFYAAQVMIRILFLGGWLALQERRMKGD